MLFPPSVLSISLPLLVYTVDRRTRMRSGLQNRHSIILPSHRQPIFPFFREREVKGREEYLQHMQQRRLARIVEPQEQQLRMLVQETQGRKDIPDCHSKTHLISPCCPSRSFQMAQR